MDGAPKRLRTVRARALLLQARVLRMLPTPRLLALLVSALAFSSCRQPEQGSAPPPAPPPEPVSYTYQVRPILARKCFPCHGRDDQRNESGLRPLKKKWSRIVRMLLHLFLGMRSFLKSRKTKTIA